MDYWERKTMTCDFVPSKEELKQEYPIQMGAVTLTAEQKGNVTGVYPPAELPSSITCSKIARRPLNDCRL